ncbi:DUF3251 domain-containing protein [Acerihabitans sp. TG2]|uniref:DUF3251 domain-containing protein n=1 Tax=Acerihabitans sp. TG2 TaxID=3096008 RepID=UPI002B23607A|nr:DUF3251 domain-containing protein [Acerihabitans sp. TG2]MEA9390778.1 DUF3251 domain-containing protein [Acerihabitans sp. TG2]
MTTSYRSFYAIAALLFLSGCAQQPNPNSSALKGEVRQLNQRLDYLNHQVSALMQQNALNEQSTGGVYLYPAARTGAQVESQIGKLMVSLGPVGTEANGSRALLQIRTADNSPLTAFHAIVDWGQVDPSSGKPLLADTLSQPITVPASLLPKPQATIELLLSGLAPEQVGYIRLHSITANSADNPAAHDAIKPRSRQ